MVNVIGYLIALAAGAANPAQAGANAQLNKDLATPIWAAMFVYLSGLGGILLMQALLRDPWPGSRIASVPWWVWIGGC